MFHPLRTQSCCASVLEPSFVQSALLISHLLSDLLQSAADTHPHICMIARCPLYLPINPVVCVVVEGDRRVSYASISITISFIILATLTHHLAFAISLHRSIFPPPPHSLHPSPVNPHHWNRPPSNSELSRFAPFIPCHPLIIFPLHHLSRHLDSIPIRSGPP